MHQILGFVLFSLTFRCVYILFTVEMHAIQYMLYSTRKTWYRRWWTDAVNSIWNSNECMVYTVQQTCTIILFYWSLKCWTLSWNDIFIGSLSYLAIFRRKWNQRYQCAQRTVVSTSTKRAKNENKAKQKSARQQNAESVTKWMSFSSRLKIQLTLWNVDAVAWTLNGTHRLSFKKKIG